MILFNLKRNSMTLSLKDFGYQIKEINNDNLIISFIKDVLNKKSPSMTSQFLASKNINQEIKEKIKEEITRDFLVKKNGLKIDLLSIDKFINDNIKNIQKIEINFGLHKSSNKLKYGNGEFVNHYIDLINNLFLALPNVKQIFQDFFKDCLDGNFQKVVIFDTLQQLELYNQIIFEEFNLMIQKNINNFKIEPNKDLPVYLQHIDKFNQYQTLLNNTKKILRFYFPKKKYNEVFSPIVENQLKQLDMILTSSTKMNSLLGLSFLEIYQKKIISNLKLTYDNNKYLLGIFYRVIKSYFNFITFHPDLDIGKLVNIYYEEKQNHKFNYFVPHILTILEKSEKNHQLHKNINNYLLNNLDDKNVTDTISDWLLRMKNQEYFIISLQNFIALKIWQFNKNKINNLLTFFNKFTSDSVSKIVTMLNDIKLSYQFNEELSNQKIYLFSSGVWNYVFQDESFNNNDITPDYPFLDKITELNDKVSKENSQLNLYLLKGNIKLSYQIDDKVLILNCLPAQAMLLKYLEDNTYQIKDIRDGLLKNLSQENFDHLIDTLEKENLVFIENNMIHLMKTLPFTGEINLADKFFITTKLEEREIEHKYVLTIKEKLPAIIKHYVKIEDYTRDNIYDLINEKFTVSKNELYDIIDYMIKMDYIQENDGKISNSI